jgi:enoyl-[acyl-carrier protein] reductase I
MEAMEREIRHFALVIGGSRGLGLATVRKLLAEGIPVIAVHRDMRRDMGEIALQFEKFSSLDAPFYAIHRDAIQEKGREAILNEIGELLGPAHKIRVLVHSIARGNLKPMVPAPGSPPLGEVDFRITGEAMAYNLYTWVQQLFDKGLFCQDSRVIAFTSEGSSRVIPGYGAVAAAKAAMEAIIRQVAVEFGPEGLRANCIQAGITPTDSMKMIPGSEALLARGAARNPLGRLTAPEDVADAVYLLTRPEANWINGAILKVDGGESLC